MKEGRKFLAPHSSFHNQIVENIVLFKRIIIKPLF